MDMEKIKLGFFEVVFRIEGKIYFNWQIQHMKNIGLYLELYQNYKVTSKRVFCTEAYFNIGKFSIYPWKLYNKEEKRKCWL